MNELLLQGKKKTFITVDYGDVEKAIEKFYGLSRGSYEFVAEEECGNDSEHSFAVYSADTQPAWSDAEQEGADLMESKRVESYKTGSYLNYMCMKGAIEPGTYLVNVSW